MSTNTGKTFGLALIMAVGILAVLFALGTFSSQKAGAQDEEPPTLAVNNVVLAVDDAASKGIRAGVETDITVSFTSTRDLGQDDAIKITLTGYPEASFASETAAFAGTQAGADGGDQAASSSTVETDNADGDQPVTFTLTLGSGESFKADTEIKATIEGIDTGTTAGVLSANVEVTDDLDNEGSETATDEADADSNDVYFGVILDTDTVSAGAGSYVSVEVATATTGDNATAIATLTEGLINSGDRITIDMENFGLPGSIDTEDVSIRGLTTTGTQAQRGEPESVRISSGKVTLIVPDMSEAEGGPESFPALQGCVQHGGRCHDSVNSRRPLRKLGE